MMGKEKGGKEKKKTEMIKIERSDNYSRKKKEGTLLYTMPPGKGRTFGPRKRRGKEQEKKKRKESMILSISFPPA